MIQHDALKIGDVRKKMNRHVMTQLRLYQAHGFLGVPRPIFCYGARKFLFSRIADNTASRSTIFGLINFALEINFDDPRLLLVFLTRMEP